MRLFISLLALMSTLKLFLFFSYSSTDFEVHRNWLSIMHSLPIEKWYHEATSEWTLDYPPLFAYFEYFLSYFANLIDPGIVKIQSTPYISTSCIVFQRMTVLLSDIVFYVAIYYYCAFNRRKAKLKGTIDKSSSKVLILSILNVGLLLVDNIHFQYNGIMMGILIFSIIAMMKGNYLMSGIIFTFLLTFKHIFIYCAPCYFLFLLRRYCFTKEGPKLPYRFNIINFVKIGFTTILIILLVFLPFLQIDTLKQVLGRLFPFKRGLLHSYWCGNFWALYAIFDKIIKIMLIDALGLNISMGENTTTSGLDQETKFHFVPSIPPFLTLIIIGIFLIPLGIRIFHNPKKSLFINYLCFSMLCFFNFGFQVHEKAILMISSIQVLKVCEDKEQAKLNLILRIVASVSIFPLLINTQETPIKVLMLCLDMLIFYLLMEYHFELGIHRFMLNTFKLLLGFLIIIYSISFLNRAMFRGKYEFLELMVISVGIACITQWLLYWVWRSTSMRLKIFKDYFKVPQKSQIKTL